jgi:hypothetical protein
MLPPPSKPEGFPAFVAPPPFTAGGRAVVGGEGSFESGFDTSPRLSLPPKSLGTNVTGPGVAVGFLSCDLPSGLGAGVGMGGLVESVFAGGAFIFIGMPELSGGAVVGRGAAVGGASGAGDFVASSAA